MKFEIVNLHAERLEEAFGISPKTAEILNTRAKNLVVNHIHEPGKVIAILGEIDLPVNEFAYFNQALGSALMLDALNHSTIKMMLKNAKII